MIDPDLTAALSNLSEATRRACQEAKRIGDAELFYALRRIGWTVADLMAQVARGQVAS